jgi:hypothetical protein
MQTPMATLHKFDGWADLFLTTPANGLGDTCRPCGQVSQGQGAAGLNYGVSAITGWQRDERTEIRQ